MRTRLTGPIPSELGDLARLKAAGPGPQRVDWDEYPPDLGKLANLERLYLNVQPVGWGRYRPTSVVSRGVSCPCI